MAAASEEARKREVRYCGICKADKEVIGIKNISQIEKLMTLVCEHKIIERLLVVNEDLNISEDFSYVILKDPVAELKRAVNDNDYFKTVAYACAVFEYCGLQILVWDSKSTGNLLPTAKKRKGDDWTLYEIINELRQRDLITETDKDKLHNIRCLRNEFIHEEGYSIKIYSETASRVNAFTTDIIDYTAKLKAVYDELAVKAEAAAAKTD